MSEEVELGQGWFVQWGPMHHRQWSHGDPLWTDRQTHNENINFLQLRWRAVISIVYEKYSPAEYIMQNVAVTPITYLQVVGGPGYHTHPFHASELDSAYPYKIHRSTTCKEQHTLLILNLSRDERDKGVLRLMRGLHSEEYSRVPLDSLVT